MQDKETLALSGLEEGILAHAGAMSEALDPRDVELLEELGIADAAGDASEDALAPGSIEEVNALTLREPIPGYFRRVRWALTRSQEAARMEAWIAVVGALHVRRSVRRMAGRFWLHLSVSRPDRKPNYAELQMCRDFFLGETLRTVQVWRSCTQPPDVRKNAVHLWAAYDGDIGLPVFHDDHVAK